MIDELFLYDKERGLFKEILNKSVIMQGRYHVSPHNLQDLNTDNLESFIKDDKVGLRAPEQRYPIAVCNTPRSRFKSINGNRWQEFYFSMFFLTRSHVTADNQIKSLDADTNTSAHHIWYDWQDMKNCADDFLSVLKAMLQVSANGTRLKTVMGFDQEGAIFSRVTEVTNDKLSGQNVLFSVSLYAGECTLADYPANVINSITVPPFTIHAPHKQ